MQFDMDALGSHDGRVSEEDLAWITLQPEGQLFDTIGGILLGGGQGFGSRDDGQNGMFARDWFESRIEGLRSVLCSHDVFQSLGGDLTNDILTVLPLLVSQLEGDALLAAIVAGIVLRRGLADFCRST